jgi:hypothetical protein
MSALMLTAEWKVTITITDVEAQKTNGTSLWVNVMMNREWQGDLNTAN